MAAAAGGSQGVVKSWNGAKGFGFISSDDYAGDIMFSRNELPDDAREVNGNFLQGKVCYFEAVEGPDGRAKAAGVQLLAVEGQGLVGKIKSYSERNGYGFITSSCLQTDVRFQTQDLSTTAPGSNLMGQLVTFFTQARPDGKLMAQKVHLQQHPGKIMGMGMGVGMGMGMAFGGGCGGGSCIGPSMAKGGGKGNGKVMNGGATMTGTVKSYSIKNGYGFINCPGRQGDVKFGAADLNAEAVEPGTSVSFTAAVGFDGRMQAKNVQPSGGMKRPMAIVPTNAAKRINAGPGACFGAVAAGSGADGQWTTGTIKSYNQAKGFGFISSPEQSSDIYFASSSVSPEAMASIMTGQAVSCELNYAPDGKVRAKTVTL